jgi:hypothetical protein
LADDQRIITIRDASESGGDGVSEVTYIQNFFTELGRRLAN